MLFICKLLPFNYKKALDTSRTCKCWRSGFGESSQSFTILKLSAGIISKTFFFTLSLSLQQEQNWAQWLASEEFSFVLCTLKLHSPKIYGDLFHRIKSQSENNVTTWQTSRGLRQLLLTVHSHRPSQPQPAAVCSKKNQEIKKKNNNKDTPIKPLSSTCQAPHGTDRVHCSQKLFSKKKKKSESKLFATLMNLSFFFSRDF